MEMIIECWEMLVQPFARANGRVKSIVSFTDRQEYIYSTFPTDRWSSNRVWCYLSLSLSKLIGDTFDDSV